MRGLRRGLALGAALLAVAALPASASAAGQPKANTGGARDVSYASATLAGTRQSERQQHLLLLPVRADAEPTAAQTAISDAGSRQRRRACTARDRRAAADHRLPLPARRSQRQRRQQRRRQHLQNDRRAALAGDPGRAQPGRVRRLGDGPGDALGHRQREPHRRAAGQHVPVHRRLPERRQPRADDPTGGFSFIVPRLEQITQFRVFTTPSAPSSARSRPRTSRCA